MAKKIALFNHKGGVSKTTTTFNLGWMLAIKGYKVIIVDADPQCNLTGLVLGYKGPSELESFYETETDRNLKSALSPAFESIPGKQIEPVDCIQIEGQNNLLLLPGHIKLAEYEVTLGIAQELSGSIQTLQNLPGSISYLLDITGKAAKADFILIDMNPSLSSLNQNLLMISDYFLIPTSPDYFSLMAINSLSSILPIWYAWAKRAQGHHLLQKASYPFPKSSPKFLGTVVQKYRPRDGRPAAAFKNWIDEIGYAVSNKLVKVMKKNNMLLEDDKYQLIDIDEDYCLSSIPDFNGLIAISQEKQTPIFSLTEVQIGQTGVVLQNTLKSRDLFFKLFDDLSEKIIKLTDTLVL